MATSFSGGRNRRTQREPPTMVISIDGNKDTMLPKHEDLKDHLEFQAGELKKHFKMGDHVRVIAGRYEGDTGKY
jgi:transcription elongation factor